MNEVTLLEAWLGGAVVGAAVFLEHLPNSKERMEAERWLHVGQALWWVLIFLFPFAVFDLTPSRVGWPWCMIDDLLIAYMFVRTLRNLRAVLKSEQEWRANDVAMDK